MDRIGQQLGSYRIVSLIGQGGFADVYLGEHLHLGTRAAIKVLQMHLVGSNLDQFRQEARTIASLVHPHIVRVLDFGIENDIPFLIMDYAENGTIRQHLPTSERIAPAKFTPYVNQIAEGLQYAHDKKFIHRDIKPDNILLDAKNNILLSDFGLVLSASSSSSQNLKEMAGTVSYMAPEQLQGKPRPASDQYSLGIVVYQWLSGNLPFNGSFTAIASQHLLVPPPPLREKIPCISPELEQVVLTALAKDPHQRFATVTAFAEALEKASLASISAVELTTKPLEQNPQKTAINANAEAAIASTAEITRPPEQPEETEIAPTGRASSDDNAPILEQPESATSTNADTGSDKLATLPEPDRPKTESEIVDEHATLLDEEATLLVAASEDTEESTDTKAAADAPTEMASEPASAEDHATEPENRTEEAEDKPEQQPTELLPAPQQAEVDPTEGPTITLAEAPALNAMTDTVNTPAKRQEPASEASPDQPQPAHRENTTENTNEGESPTALIPTPEASSPTEVITSAVARNKHSQATHRHRLPAAQPIQEVSVTQPVTSIQSPARLPAPQIYYGLPGTPAQPRRRKRRDYRALIIILLLLITLVSAGTGVIYFAPGTARAFIQFARNALMPKGPTPTAGPGRQVTPIASTPVAITLTEDKENFKDTFRILAITGTPDSTKNQVSARILTATSPIQSQTVKISNPTSISATRATGNLLLTNTSASTIQLAAETTFTSTSGVTIALDSAASIPASQTLMVIAHATASGAAGNIVALDLNTCLSSGNVPPTPTPTPTVPPGGCTTGTVQNYAAFSGGQDAHNANVVQQSNIDSATQKLSDALTSNTQQQLQAQIHANEQAAGSPVCAPKVTPDHAVGDQADNLTVTGTLICTTEVFNSNAAQALAAQDLKDQIASNGKSNGYERTSNVSASVISVSTPDSSNTIKLDITASGEWIYQLSDTQKQDLLHQIAGKSRQEAQNILLTQNGITNAVLPPEVQTLPSDLNKISFIVQ